ncbi:MAG TPA: hypothetical protein VLA99_05955 [Nitrospiraceae bacterium]|nr:hypothetical protein [Nitrospiraceae bacterium]
MAKSEILDALPGAKRKTIAHEEDGVWRVESRQDCEHIVKAAKIMSEMPQSKDFKLAAVIPETVLNQAFLEGWFHDKAKWREWANDPQNREFRVWPGRL